MKKQAALLGALLALSGCSAMQEDDEMEQEIALDSVPAPILAAARSAVPGIELEEAEFEEEDGAMIYELEGVVGGQRYEVEISQEGEVLEVEKVDDEED